MAMLAHNNNHGNQQWLVAGQLSLGIVLQGFAKYYLLSSDSYRNWFGYIFARIVSSARVNPFPRSRSVHHHAQQPPAPFKTRLVVWLSSTPLVMMAQFDFILSPCCYSNENGDYLGEQWQRIK